MAAPTRDSVGTIAICVHGGLRRHCEPCDLAERLGAAEARVQALEADIEAFNRTDHDRDGAARVWHDLYRAAEVRVQALECEVAALRRWVTRFREAADLNEHVYRSDGDDTYRTMALTQRDCADKLDATPTD